jgi:branched-chain amino acid aminotransferase
MKAAVARKPLIRIAVVESDPLRFVGFRALFDSEPDLELVSASLADLGQLPSIDLVLLGNRSGQNLFVVKHGRLRTPPPYAGILKGVTRDVVIELAGKAGYDVQESILNRYDVYTADEAFFTGTASELIAIRQVDGRLIGTGKAGPVTRDLRARFQAFVRS